MCGGGGGREGGGGGGEKNGSASQRARDGDREREIVTFIYLSFLLVYCWTVHCKALCFRVDVL